VLGELISEGVLILSFLCVILSFSCFSNLFLALLCRFAWLCHLSCRLLAFAIVFLLDDFLELFWLFGSSSCASWGLGFEL
jgi:hypothetical protein